MNDSFPVPIDSRFISCRSQQLQEDWSLGPEVQTQRVSTESDFPRPERGKNSRISGRGRTISWGGWTIGWTSWPVRASKVGGATVVFNGCQMSQKHAQRNAERFDRKCPQTALSTGFPKLIAGRDDFYSRICWGGRAVEGNIEVGEGCKR